MNMLDDAIKNSFLICDDKTRQTRDVTQRLGPLETVAFVQDAYVKILASSPKIHDYEMYFVLSSLCAHVGWTSAEVAALERYATLEQTLTAETQKAR